MSKNSQDINPSNRHQLENLLDGLSDFVSSDVELAKEYLEEEGVEQDKLIQENIRFIQKLKAEALLDQGQKKQSWFATKKQQFLEKFKSNPDNVRSNLSSLNLQINFRNLDTDGLSEDELDRLFEDASFLDYIENEFPDGNETETE